MRLPARTRTVAVAAAVTLAVPAVLVVLSLARRTDGTTSATQMSVETVVTTFAGSGARGFGDGPGRTATFNRPVGVAVDAADTVYVADQGNDLSRKMTPDGVVTTVAGSGVRGFAGGPSRAARFNRPFAVAVDGEGNLYVADQGNDVIRKVTVDGAVSIFAGSGERGFGDGPGRAAQFNAPAGIALDAAGNLYVADQGNDLIRVITPHGMVESLAGSGERGFADGLSHLAQFNGPTGIAIDTAGNLYVAEETNNLVRKVTLESAVTVLAGSGGRGFANGSGREAKFNRPVAAVVDGAGNVYVADHGNDLIRKVTSDGVVTAYAGSGDRGYRDGSAGAAQFNAPAGLALDNAGNLYVADQGNALIRKVAPDGAVSTFAGSGQRGFADVSFNEARITKIYTLALHGALQIYVADHGNDLIRKVAPDGTVATLAGNGERGFADGPGGTARFNAPAGIAVAGETVYVADQGNDLVRKVAPDGTVSTLAGAGQRGFTDGPPELAQFNAPTGLAVDGAGVLYVADRGNDLIRRVTPAGAVGSFAGAGERGFADGPTRMAQFNAPSGVALDRAGNLYVADEGNNLVRKVTTGRPR